MLPHPIIRAARAARWHFHARASLQCSEGFRGSMVYFSVIPAKAGIQAFEQLTGFPYPQE